jgi:hypothetical protein
MAPNTPGKKNIIEDLLTIKQLNKHGLCLIIYTFPLLIIGNGRGCADVASRRYPCGQAHAWKRG